MSARRPSQDSSRKKFLENLNKISILSGREDDDNSSIDSNTTVIADGASGAAHDSAKQSCFFTILVACMGVASAAMFMSFGITSAINKASQDFHHVADEISLQLVAAWDDYEMGSRWLHQACHNKSISREGFRDLYEYMAVSLQVQVRYHRK
jgi:hypothetical protein